MSTPVWARFWSKVRVTNGCWLWTGYINPNGYGYFQSGGRGDSPRPAHRAAWKLTGHTLPKGAYLRNHCGNRACVRPSHHTII